MNHRVRTVAVVLVLLGGLGLSSPAAVAAGQDTEPPPTPFHFFMSGRSDHILRFYWTWTSDPSGVPFYELTVNGRTVRTNHSPGFSVDASELDFAPGNAYPVELRAVDGAGNRSAEPARLTFETTTPGVATNLRQVSTRNGYPDVVHWDHAPDNSGRIGDYEVFLDGQSLGFTGGVASISLYSKLFLELCIDPPTGPATVHVRATDPSFNTGTLSPPLTVVFP